MFTGMGPGNTAAPAAVGHSRLGKKTQDKGALTRFNNDRVAAARSMMQNSASGSTAAQSLKFDTNSIPRANNSGVQGPAQDSANAPMQMPTPNTGPQQMLQEPQIDPLSNLRAQISLQEFLNSTEFGDAVVKNKLKNYFRGENDESDLGFKVLADLAGQTGERGIR